MRTYNENESVYFSLTGKQEVHTLDDGYRILTGKLCGITDAISNIHYDYDLVTKNEEFYFWIRGADGVNEVHKLEDIGGEVNFHEDHVIVLMGDTLKTKIGLATRMRLKVKKVFIEYDDFEDSLHKIYTCSA